MGHVDLGWTLHVLGHELTAQKKLAEAETVLREALPILEQQVGPQTDGVAWTLTFLSEAARELGKSSEADALADRAKRIRANTAH